MLLDPSARGTLGNPGLRCWWMWDKQGNLLQNKSFGGKDQQQESCNSAFFVKKTKQNNNPKHRTTQTFNRFVNHRHKRIKKYSKKYIARDILFYKAIRLSYYWLTSTWSVVE